MKFKPLYIVLLSALVWVSGHAQYTTDGYYRVSNYATGRYIYVYDNTGSINISTSSADMGAIQLWKDINRTYTDPASILYIKKIHTTENGVEMFDITSQGTGIHEIIGYYINIYYLSSSNTYQVYAEGKYLCDNETSSRALGFLGTERKGDYRKWIISPLNLTDNYLAINPSIKIGGYSYAPYYVGFPFKMENTSAKAYYISKIIGNVAIKKEVTGNIPEECPVFIETPSAAITSNKITPLLESVKTQSDNILKGVYFNNEDRLQSPEARTEYNPSTMRVLGVTSEGKLGFVTASIEWLPANQSYLPVSSNTPEELTVMTEDEFIISQLSAKEVESVATREYFDIYGNKVTPQHKGIIIEKSKDGTSKKIYRK